MRHILIRQIVLVETHIAAIPAAFVAAENLAACPVVVSFVYARHSYSCGMIVEALFQMNAVLMYCAAKAYDHAKALSVQEASAAVNRHEGYAELVIYAFLVELLLERLVGDAIPGEAFSPFLGCLFEHLPEEVSFRFLSFRFHRHFPALSSLYVAAHLLERKHGENPGAPSIVDGEMLHGLFVEREAALFCSKFSFF